MTHKKHQPSNFLLLFVSLGSGQVPPSKGEGEAQRSTFLDYQRSEARSDGKSLRVTNLILLAPLCSSLRSSYTRCTVPSARNVFAAKTLSPFPTLQIQPLMRLATLVVGRDILELGLDDSKVYSGLHPPVCVYVLIHCRRNRHHSYPCLRRAPGAAPGPGRCDVRSRDEDVQLLELLLCRREAGESMKRYLRSIIRHI